jgi:hypothetical protein
MTRRFKAVVLAFLSRPLLTMGLGCSRSPMNATALLSDLANLASLPSTQCPSVAITLQSGGVYKLPDNALASFVFTNRSVWLGSGPGGHPAVISGMMGGGGGAFIAASRVAIANVTLALASGAFAYASQALEARGLRVHNFTIMSPSDFVLQSSGNLTASNITLHGSCVLSQGGTVVSPAAVFSALNVPCDPTYGVVFEDFVWEGSVVGTDATQAINAIFAFTAAPFCPRYMSPRLSLGPGRVQDNLVQGLGSSGLLIASTTVVTDHYSSELMVTGVTFDSNVVRSSKPALTEASASPALIKLETLYQAGSVSLPVTVTACTFTETVLEGSWPAYGILAHSTSDTTFSLLHVEGTVISAFPGNFLRATSTARVILEMFSVWNTSLLGYRTDFFYFLSSRPVTVHAGDVVGAILAGFSCDVWYTHNCEMAFSNVSVTGSLLKAPGYPSLGYFADSRVSIRGWSVEESNATVPSGLMYFDSTSGDDVEGLTFTGNTGQGAGSADLFLYPSYVQALVASSSGASSNWAPAVAFCGSKTATASPSVA